MSEQQASRTSTTTTPGLNSATSSAPIAIPTHAADSTTPSDPRLAPITASSPSSSFSRSRHASSTTRRRRFSADDSPKPNSSYPFGADAAALEPLGEEPSRDPRDTSAPTPTSSTAKESVDSVAPATADTAGGSGFLAGAVGGGGGGGFQSAYARGGGGGGGAGGVDFDGLSWPSTGTRGRLEAQPEEMKAQKERLADAVRTILECVGEDVQREGLLKTPYRYAEALMYFTNGYEQNLRDIVNGAIFNEDHDEMIIVRDIEINSSCEHHLVPFFGRMHIGYIPNGRVLGLSKFARIADMFARRLQVQERLTKQVAAAINEVLKPQGVAVVVECTHLCMVMRGVQQTQSTTTTSCMLGAFERRDRTRQEFLSLALRR